MNTLDPVFLTENEAAKLLGYKAQTLRVWRTQRRGPRWAKDGKSRAARVRYRIEDLRDWAAGLVVIRPGRPKGSKKKPLPPEGSNNNENGCS